MNLLADEGVERQIVERLRQAGHDVWYIAEMEPGIADDVVLAQANASQALLITLDKDFGELVYRQGLVHAGVILLRLAGFCQRRKPRSWHKLCSTVAWKWCKPLALFHPVPSAFVSSKPSCVW